MALNTKVDDKDLEAHMFNFANRESDLREIASVADVLTSDTRNLRADLEKLLVQLFTPRNFYGSYHELRVYGWLLKNGVRFKAQSVLDARRVINPNGSTLDGRFDDIDIFFDIKSFGFHYKAKEDFRKKLSRLLKCQVVISGPMDVSINHIAQHALRQVRAIADRLRVHETYRVPHLNWDIRIIRGERVSIETATTDPYRVAKENRHYVLNYAKKFTKIDPFLLIFGFGYEFNRVLHVNFANHTDIIFRSMARRFFIELVRDSRRVSELPKGFSNQLGNVTIGDVARLLSGVLFVNVDDGTSWLFVNPNAKNRMTDYHVEQMFDFHVPRGMSIENFENDNY